MVATVLTSPRIMPPGTGIITAPKATKQHSLKPQNKEQQAKPA
jgi:hypothetical protein